MVVFPCLLLSRIPHSPPIGGGECAIKCAINTEDSSLLRDKLSNFSVTYNYTKDCNESRSHRADDFTCAIHFRRPKSIESPDPNQIFET